MKTYVEVGCTKHMTMLVEVEHSEDTPIEAVFEMAKEEVYEAEGPFDEIFIAGTVPKKPESVFARYDEFLEIEV